MIVDTFPDRTIQVEGEEYLYFGGTNYLGMSTNIDFQNLLFESIKNWGTAYGSSRNSNIKLSVFEKSEHLLAKNLGTENALTVSSGMLAGKLVVDYVTKITDAIFHFPHTHPALMDEYSLPIIINGKLNSKIINPNISKISIVSDAIPCFNVTPIDLEILSEIPTNIEIILVIDESHSIGIYDNQGLNYIKNKNINIIKIASLGKAYALSGGVIGANSTIISEIKNQNSFVGASGMNPSFLNTFINAQDLYLKQKNKVVQNLNFITTHLINKTDFTFNSNYPIIYFDNPTIFEKLETNKIITTSFQYTSSKQKMSRIVINANHTINDLEKLVSVLNSVFYKKPGV